MARQYPGKLSKVIAAHYAKKPPTYEFNSLHLWLLELETIIGERYPHASGRTSQ